MPRSQLIRDFFGGVGRTARKPAFVLVAAFYSSSAFALTIIRNEITAGNTFPGIGGTATGAPGTIAGPGTLSAIFNAAADCWEHHILTNHTVTISFGWQGLSGGALGLHNLLSQGGTPNRETAGVIRFDSDGSSSWFMDGTPHLPEEYATYTQNFADLGGGTMNTGRRFTGATGNALGRYDLFSVALHEIGHALGLSSANNSFIAENGDGDIDVTAPRPFAGATIPTVSGAHLNISTSLMYPTASPSVRSLITDVDLVANLQISQFNEWDLSPCGVPEPASLAALGFGLALLSRRRRRVA